MLKRICQICGNGYNRPQNKCRKCGNKSMAKVKVSHFSNGIRRFTYDVQHDEETEKMIDRMCEPRFISTPTKKEISALRRAMQEIKKTMGF